MSKKPHWKVIMDATDWPRIQSQSHADPFVSFSDGTPIGQRGAVRWADLLCLWMNEQMRLGVVGRKARLCDPMLVVKVRALEKELKALNEENHTLSGKLIKAQTACRDAGYKLAQAVR